MVCDICRWAPIACRREPTALCKNTGTKRSDRSLRSDWACPCIRGGTQRPGRRGKVVTVIRLPSHTAPTSGAVAFCHCGLSCRVKQRGMFLPGEQPGGVIPATFCAPSGIGSYRRDGRNLSGNKVRRSLFHASLDDWMFFPNRTQPGGVIPHAFRTTSGTMPRHRRDSRNQPRNNYWQGLFFNHLDELMLISPDKLVAVQVVEGRHRV